MELWEFKRKGGRVGRKEARGGRGEGTVGGGGGGGRIAKLKQNSEQQGTGSILL